MKQIILAMFTLFAAVILAACGSGGESSDSSFSGTKTFGATSFSCSSESAQNSCTSSTSCSSCTCTTGCTTTGTAITTTCAVSGTTLTATSAGCTGNASGTQTFVCDGTKLMMLSGTGHTAAAVIAGGSTFGGNVVNVSGVTIKCS